MPSHRIKITSVAMMIFAGGGAGRHQRLMRRASLAVRRMSLAVRTRSVRARRGLGLVKAFLPDHDAYTLGFRIKNYFGLASFELCEDPRHLVLQREFLFAVVGALAQYKGFDHRLQQILRQLGMRHFYGF